MATATRNIPGGIGGLGKLTELRQRLLFLLGAIVVFRVCTHIPVPGINPVALADLFNSQSGTILGMFNMFSGGALERFSVVAWASCPTSRRPSFCNC
jgi:preprotein translocase subunit SecY